LLHVLPRSRGVAALTAVARRVRIRVPALVGLGRGLLLALLLALVEVIGRRLALPHLGLDVVGLGLGVAASGSPAAALRFVRPGTAAVAGAVPVARVTCRLAARLDGGIRLAGGVVRRGLIVAFWHSDLPLARR